MRLFYITKGTCQHIMDMMPGIKAIYEMEATFAPYLSVEFLPFRTDAEEEIILLTKNGTIRKNYTLANKKDVDDLRNLIWSHLVKEEHIKPARNENDFREAPPAIVVQGWQARKRASEKAICCKFIVDTITSEVLKNNILHEVYRLNLYGKEDKNICKKLRFQECGDNYPPNTPTFERCVREVEWLCNHGYPINKSVNTMNQIAKNIWLKIYKYLDKHNLKVNKKKFDEIMDAGLFVDLGNRMGNKVANDKNVSATLDHIFTEKDYYLGLIEGFEDERFNVESQNNNNNIFKWVYGICLLIILLVLLYMKFKKN